MHHRLHIKFRNEKLVLKQAAVYSGKKDDLRKVRDLVILFNGLATNSRSLLKFIAFRWKVMVATNVFAKLIRFNKKILRNTKIDIGE